MKRHSLWFTIAIFSLLNCAAQAFGQASAASTNTVNANALQFSASSTVAADGWRHQTNGTNVPNTGQTITPLAPRGATFTYLNPQQAAYPDRLVGFAVTAITSPDHKTLVVLTSGDYGIYTSTGAKDTAASTEFLFIYDITHLTPVQKQVIQITNSYNGMVFDPKGKAFYAAGGRDDSVHVYTVSAGVWAEAAGSPIAMNHTAQQGGVAPVAAGIDITADGKRLVVTNYENDSITLLTKSQGVWSKTADYDLRPGVINPAASGVPGGEYPFWVRIRGNITAYISSIRDREIDVVDISTETPVLTKRIKLTGQPLKSAMNPSQNMLYVAEDQSDSVAQIELNANVLTAEVKATAPAGLFSPAVESLTGNNTNSVTVSPDGSTLYVTNANMNNVAVLNLPLQEGVDAVRGLIPTGQYPNSVALSKNGQYVYVVNGKSPAGPNPGWCSSYTTPTNCAAANQYSLQLTKAGLQAFPVPSASELDELTLQVAKNNHYLSTERPETAVVMDFLASKIKHVVYIIKENRTFDQLFGAMPGVNGDPSLEAFDPANTPNFHNFAQNFVTLDNFYDIAEVSYDGWAWSTSGLAPDIVLRQTPVNYSFRGGTGYESEGQNRGVNLVYRVTYPYPPGNEPTPVVDPNLLPGLVNTDAPDGPYNQINAGYLWSQALAAGMTVRNYGFYMDRIGNAVPYPENTTIRQGNPADAALNPNTDVYFRGYDMNNADFYLYQEWAREFNTMYAKKGFPNLTLIRLPHDHFGSFSTALAGVNTPELQLADNDYAVGKIVETIAHSKYADSTLVFVIEDDAQDGGDHVDAHRSTAFIVGPYVKQGGVVVSTQYNTINFIRTMERVLGFPPNHLTNAIAQPMANVFDITQPPSWTYTAVPSPILYNTTLPLPPKSAALRVPKPTHDAKYWARVTRGFDFSDADRVDPVAFNRILWKGLKGDTVYPGDANLNETHIRYAEALKKRGSAVPDKDGE